jgi:hypothetical protein
MLTGKTIGQLTLLNNPTADTLLPVELNGDTYHIVFSALSSNSTVEVTYSELVDKITGETLNTGSFYIITDFKTCYDQPDYDYTGTRITNGIYRDDTEVQPIIVFATSSNTISDVAYQPAYPNDKIKYDWTFSATERTSGVTYGRITERIDGFNNRTDYDHRQVKFKRYAYYEISFNNPYNGTVEVISTSPTEMVVSGTNTNFTSLLVGDTVGFNDSTYKVFTVTNIDSDSGMTITGLTTTSFGPGYKMYSTNFIDFVSYYQNNIDGPVPFEEYYTFESGFTNSNNYLGNHANLYSWEENDYILSNNVFHYNFINNKFGDSCFNNTFFDDCYNNNIGNYFYNNITDDDFDGNVIGNWFRNNKITSNFQYNRIGENFENNYLVQNSFYRNNIMNYFQNNQISNGDFQNNEIGNQFGNNKIYSQFYKNDIGNGYNGNTHYADSYGNLIGNGFNGNNVFCQMYENKIGDIFESNDLGDDLNYGAYSFYKNDIGSDFRNNDCFGTFAFNRIGSEFYNNTIEDGFGYGVNTSQGNSIGSYFYGNTIGEYFYNNTIADGFFDNQIYDYFQMNNIKVPFLNGIDFTFYYGNITGITWSTSASGLTDNTYTNLNGSITGTGENATYDVVVSGGVVTNVTINSVGKFYQIGTQTTLPGEYHGGITGIDDIIVTVTGISPTPSVYESYNCDLFKNAGNIDRLSFYDSQDILTIKNINE